MLRLMCLCACGFFGNEINKGLARGQDSPLFVSILSNVIQAFAHVFLLWLNAA